LSGGLEEMAREPMGERARLESHLRLLTDAGNAVQRRNGTTDSDSSVTYDKGPWTALKLICLEYYIPAYIDILHRQGRRIAYVDLFAGPGLNLIGSNHTPFPGSPLVPLIHRDTGRCFDFHLLSDSNRGRAEALRSRMSSWRSKGGSALIDGQDYLILSEDANELARKVPSMLNERGVSHALIFIDPEGFDLEWSSLSAMAEGFPRADLILLFPSAGVPRVLGLYDESGYAKMRRAIGPGSEMLGPGSTEEDALELYRANLKSIGKELSTEIRITGPGGFHYHLIPAVRETSSGNPWFRVLMDAKSLVEGFGPDIVQIVMDQVEGRMGCLDV